MKTRVPKQSVNVVRNGKLVQPEIGQPFDFEDQEVEDIERMNPDALSSEATVDLTKEDGKKKGGKKPAEGAAEGGAPTGNEAL